MASGFFDAFLAPLIILYYRLGAKRTVMGRRAAALSCPVSEVGVRATRAEVMLPMNPAGSDARMKELFRTNSPAVKRYALRHGASSDDAEDVVAETFFVAWRRLDEVPNTALPWLLRVARRVLLNQSISGAHREVLTGQLASELLLPAVDFDPFDAAVKSDAQRRLIQALSLLEEADREILLLAFWEGLTVAEIAGVLGIGRRAAGMGLKGALDELMNHEKPLPSFDAQGREAPGLGRSPGLLRDLGPVAPGGGPLPKDSPQLQIIRATIVKASNLLVERLALNPQLLHSLKPVEFEELVADLFLRMGYSVDFTPITRDGGVDLWVAEKKDIGTFKYAVQCKRHAAKNKVGVQLIRGALRGGGGKAGDSGSSRDDFVVHTRRPSI